MITRLILGGAQEVVLDATVGLRERGHDVTLVTGPARGPEGELFTEATHRGIEPVLVPALCRAINPFLDPIAYWQLVRLFRQLKPDVVHSHSSKAGLLARYAARAAGVPVIVHTIHGLPFHDRQNRLARRLFIACEQSAARVSDKIIVVSHAMAVNAAMAGIGPIGSFRKIFAGFDVDAFSKPDAEQVVAFRKQWGADPENIIIGTVGRLAPLKGHADLIDAFASLAAVDPRLRLVLVGDGVLRSVLTEQVQQRGITDRVVFTGLIDRQQVPAAIGAIDLLAHASVREGLARVLPQAVVAGKPVICYNLDGANEVISEQTGGTLVEPEDVVDLTEKLKGLCKRLPEATQKVQTAKRYVARHFSIRKMIDALEKLYQEVADEKG